jgi:hypothetical protein
MMGTSRNRSSHEFEAVDLRHHEILEDHRRADLGGDLEGGWGVLAEVEGHSLLAGEHAPHGLADDRLVVDEQDGGAAGSGGRGGGHRAAGAMGA